MKRYRANGLLTSRSIEDACAAACQNYYLRDTGWSSSAADFKERLGGARLSLRSLSLERLPFSAAERGAKSIVKRAIGFQGFMRSRMTGPLVWIACGLPDYGPSED
jgi:hypothetical protein